MSAILDTAMRNFEREFADIFGRRVSTEHARRLVRGVISDIREPTLEMVLAGALSTRGKQRELADEYTAMIDSTLA